MATSAEDRLARMGGAREKSIVPLSEVKLVIEEVIGVAVSAQDALGMIGHHWDKSDAGPPVKGFYTFDMDMQRFKVMIEPLVDPDETTPFD